MGAMFDLDPLVGVLDEVPIELNWALMKYA